MLVKFILHKFIIFIHNHFKTDQAFLPLPPQPFHCHLNHNRDHQILHHQIYLNHHHCQSDSFTTIAAKGFSVCLLSLEPQHHPSAAGTTSAS